MEKSMTTKHYVHLLLMAALSFVAMYILMYAMVDRLANALPNINQAYMAALMTAPMILIELLVMRSMYPDKKLTGLVAVGALLVGVGSWFGIREQAAVADSQFLRSMIPHHAAAILMCEEAQLRDAEVEALCGAIIANQTSEIDQMKAKLAKLGAQ
jgi:uncharacterized protein (DUF305 family)